MYILYFFLCGIVEEVYLYSIGCMMMGYDYVRVGCYVYCYGVFFFWLDFVRNSKVGSDEIVVGLFICCIWFEYFFLCY